MTLINSQTWEHLLGMALEGVSLTRRQMQEDALDASLLPRAYAHCSALTARHSRSFYVASSLLPAPKRRAVRALYAFCRISDDLVDEAHAMPDLTYDAWRAQILSSTVSPDDLVTLAWADTRITYHIPHSYVEQLLDGVLRDLNQTRYQTFEDLATYCYGVASTVGLMSMHIVGFASGEAIPYAIKLGIALQLTNILRDVAEDRDRGRIYLPQQELQDYGLCEDDIAQGQVTDRWRAFMAFQISRARQLYAEAAPGLDLLDYEGRHSIAAAATIYGAILDDIEANDYDVFSRRAYVGTTGKLRHLVQTWLRIHSRMVSNTLRSGWPFNRAPKRDFSAAVQRISDQGED